MTLSAQPPTAPVRSQPPPRWLMTTVVNPFARRLVPVLGRWSGPLVVLRFTGRRSGRTYEIPVVGHELDGATVVLTDAGWALNFRGGRPVTLLGAGRRRSGQAFLIETPDETIAAIRRVLAGLPSARALGLHIEPDHEPSDDELLAVRRVVRLPV